MPTVQEFSLRIERASYDKASGEMRWRAVASDTDSDLANDNMSLELFNDFIGRIANKEVPPPDFTSDFWKGGMPYVSLSHYLDLNGKAVPGTVDAIYVDGNRLKAKGKFFDNDLGRACFKSICKDLANTATDKPPVRISIAFLDYEHEHKSNGMVFYRSSVDDICLECAKEFVKNKKYGKIFKSGLLIHLAMTRVPMNRRTAMEVDKSMTTRKEDALSIVENADLVEEMEKESQLIGKSDALVIKAKKDDKKEDSDVSNQNENATVSDEEMDDDEDCSEEMAAKGKCKDKKMDEMKAELAEIKSLLVKLSETSAPEVHPLDEIFTAFKANFDEVFKDFTTSEERLMKLQEPYALIGKSLVELAKANEVPAAQVETKSDAQPDLVSALTQALTPLYQKLDLVLAQRSAAQPVSVDQPDTVSTSVPQRRSINPLQAQSLVARSSTSVQKSQTPKLRSIIERTT